MKIKFAEFREYQRAMAAYKDKMDKVAVLAYVLWWHLCALWCALLLSNEREREREREGGRGRGGESVRARALVWRDDAVDAVKSTRKCVQSLCYKYY